MIRWMVFGAAIAALVGAGPVEAFSFLDQEYGTTELGLSVRARAMGGAGSAMGQGAFSLADNPAGMVLSAGNQMNLNGWLARSSENRFVPVFDTFDSYVDENAIAVNDNGYAGIEGGVVVDRSAGATGLVLGAGLFTKFDPRYDYFDEIRTAANTDVMLGRQYISTEGVLRTAVLGASYRMAPGCGVGLALNYYYGTLDHRNTLVATPDADFETTTSRLERKIDGVSVTLGGTARVDERLQVAAALETAPKLNDDWTRWNDGVIDTTTLSSGDLDLPLRFQAGFTYRPRNTLRTTFAADVVYMPWSDVSDDLYPDQKLQDTWEARFGLEHVFYNEMAGRIGFRYGDSYAMDEAARAAFTFGFGYVMQAMHVDVAGEVGKRNSRQDPIRDRATLGGRVGLGTDHVEDTLVRVFLGASYSF